MLVIARQYIILCFLARDVCHMSDMEGSACLDSCPTNPCFCAYAGTQAAQAMHLHDEVIEISVEALKSSMLISLDPSLLSQRQSESLRA